MHTHTDADAHRYISHAVSIGWERLSPPACLSSVSSSKKLIFHLVLHRFQSPPPPRPPPAAFHILLSSYRFPVWGIHADITKAGACYCDVPKCQLVLSVKCDWTTVYIKREADTKQINESMNGIWLIHNYWSFCRLLRSSVPLSLNLYSLVSLLLSVPSVLKCVFICKSLMHT